MKKTNWLRLIGFIVLTEAVGMISGLLSGGISGEYSTIAKPPLSPPGMVFGIVWPILYLLMGIAAYLIVQSNDYEKDNALKYFWLQLAVNFFWPIIFFRFMLFWAAVLVLILLIVLVIITMVKFKRINNTSFWLMVPYLLWIIFALYLNIGTALLN